MLPKVLGILKTLRIGSLSLEDMAEEKSNADKDSDDPYAKASLLALCFFMESGQRGPVPSWFKAFPGAKSHITLNGRCIV